VLNFVGVRRPAATLNCGIRIADCRLKPYACFGRSSQRNFWFGTDPHHRLIPNPKSEIRIWQWKAAPGPEPYTDLAGSEFMALHVKPLPGQVLKIQFRFCHLKKNRNFKT
jgi:hypothetical protein